MVSVIILVDTLFYAALAPILPQLSDEFGLSKGQAGVLVASFAAGSLAGSVPAGWLVARVGARPILVAGLLTMGSAGLAFALADSIALLDGARFVQGLGGAATWTAGLAWLAIPRRPSSAGRCSARRSGPRSRRPARAAMGAIAVAIGRGPAFGSAAVLGILMAGWALTADAPAAAAPRTMTLAGALRDRPFRAALWITLLPAACFGMVEVLVPLRLDVLRATTLAIAAVFFAAALVEAVMSPLTGRWADRHGARGAVRTGLLGTAAGLVLLTLPGTWPGLRS